MEVLCLLVVSVCVFVFPQSFANGLWLGIASALALQTLICTLCTPGNTLAPIQHEMQQGRQEPQLFSLFRLAT